MSTGNPYQAPQTPITQPGMFPPGTNLASGTLATLMQRFAGALVDFIILIPIYFGIGLVMAIVFVASNTAQNIDFSNQEQAAQNIQAMSANAGTNLVTSIITTILSCLVFSAVNFVFLKQSGQTIGKKILGTRIVTLDGQIPSLGTSLGKRFWLMQLIYAIPIVGGLVGLVGILLIFGSERRCLHDLIAGTRVVQV